MKTFTFISSLTIISALVFLGTTFYWLTKEYDPIDVKNEPVPVLGSNISPGDYVILEVDYCKSVRVRRVYNIFLVGSTTKTQLNDIDGISGEGCHHVFAPFPIPKILTPGTYYFEFIGNYDVNPFRRIQDGFISQQFTVI